MGYIDDMFIIKKYRNRDIAQKFLNELFVWFKSKKLSNIEITTHAKNEIGKKAWAKYGFEEYIIRLKTNLKIK